MSEDGTIFSCRCRKRQHNCIYAKAHADSPGLLTQGAPVRPPAAEKTRDSGLRTRSMNRANRPKMAYAPKWGKRLKGPISGLVSGNLG